MFIYILLMISVVVLRLFIKDKKKYCITCGILMLLLVGIKEPTLGNSDNSTLYIPGFYRVMNFSFSQVANYYSFSDIYFFIFTKFITFFCKNINIYFIICELPLCFFGARYIYKYSKIPFLSFIMLICLNYFSWSFIIIRHSVALGFIIWSYDFIKNKNLFKFVLTIIFASLFHKTALIFLVAYPLCNYLKLSKKTIYILLLLAFGIIFFFGDDILNWIYSLLSSSSRYLMYQKRESVMGLGGIITYLFVLISSMIFSKKMDEDYLGYILIFCGVILTMMTIHLAEFFRIAMFFNIFGISILPNALSKIKDVKTRYVICIMLCIIFGVYGITSFDNLNLIPFVSIFSK